MTGQRRSTSGLRGGNGRCCRCRDNIGGTDQMKRSYSKRVIHPVHQVQYGD